MCIGIPLQVVAVEPGHAHCVGRGGRRRVGTLLVGDVAPGDWLLVFLDNAQERIDAVRAAEIDATLDLLEQALGPEALGSGAAAFELPSSRSAAQMRALVGDAPRGPAAASDVADAAAARNPATIGDSAAAATTPCPTAAASERASDHESTA